MSYEEISAYHPKARKEYGCEWCGEKVLVGEKHLSRCYKMEGEFRSGRMHLECEQAMYDAPRDEVADGWLFGEHERGSK